MNGVVHHDHSVPLGKTFGPSMKCLDAIFRDCACFEGGVSRLCEDKGVNRSANVTPSDLKRVSPLIAQGQCLCHRHCIFPSWGVVAVQQAVCRPLKFFRRPLLTRRV